jgi:hypothetical protein
MTDDKEYLTRVLDNVDKYNCSHEQGYLSQWAPVRDKVTFDNDILELDKRYLSSGEIFAKSINDEYCDIKEGDAWYWHIASIVKGEYPLDKLPEHVREVAKELYYD